MSAIVVQGKRSVEVTTFYTVSGAEPMPIDYSKRMFVPERVTITDQNGFVSYVVGGRVPKKDGTLIGGGKRSRYDTRRLDREPEWLQALIRGYLAEAEIEIEEFGDDLRQVRDRLRSIARGES